MPTHPCVLNEDGRLTSPVNLTADRISKIAEVLLQAHTWLMATRSRYSAVWDAVPIAGQIWRPDFRIYGF